MYCLTLADAADDRLVFGSDLGAGYPYTDLVYGVPDMNGQLLYAGLFQPENIGTRKLYSALEFVWFVLFLCLQKIGLPYLYTVLYLTKYLYI